MKHVLPKAGELRPSQEWGCFTAFSERNLKKLRNDTPTQDIVTFFFISGKKNAGKSSLTYVQAPRPPPHFYILCSHVSGIVSANGSEAKEPQESGRSKTTTIFPSYSPCEF